MPLRWIGTALAVASLAACGSTTSTPAKDTMAVVAGTIRSAASAQATQNTTTASLATSIAPASTIKVGELIVRLKDETATPPARITHGGRTYTAHHALGIPGAWLYALSNDATTSTISTSSVNVLSVEPNVLLMPALQSSEPLAPQQWNVEAIKLPQAWDATTGTTTIVAVLDTGILHDGDDSSNTHPDLVGRVVSGYDFISSSTAANDGDGRDANAFDSGSPNVTQPSHHGSHVAGIIAAAANNQGITGVNWNARVLPVRVLTDEGGTLTDLIDGLLWAAGENVPGVPRNANPASIINLSLSAQGACPSLLQTALDKVHARGVVVIAAAGNAAMNAANVLPGNCRNVITVGATGRNGTRSSYSNHGARIDIMAPGGDTSNLQQEGILSLGRNKSQFTYTRMIGTSMAAPHVAGVASLIKAVAPTLRPEQVLTVLQSSATGMSAAQCGQQDNACGAGLLNAAEAINRANSRTLVVARSLSGNGVMIRSDLGVVADARSYTLSNLPAGQYAIEAFVDVNGNGTWDASESGAKFPKTIEVKPGQTVAGIDLEL